MTTDEKPQTLPKLKATARHQQRQVRERWFMVGTVLIVIAAWIYGYVSNGSDAAALVQDVLPGAAEIRTERTLFVGLDETGNVIGYAAVGSASGYGGPIDMLVGVDVNGRILGATIIEQRESPGFFRLIERSDLIASYSDKAITDPLKLGEDLDAVSGATISSEGIASSIKVALRTIAADGLNDPLPPERKPIKFGAPELVLILLFASGYTGHKLRDRRWKSRVRWGTLIAGMIFLGFVYTAPLTITMVISLLSGYWPAWQNNLYWYLLIGGILFVTTVDAKNPYCSWFCPFGAFQECLAAVSKAKLYRPRNLNEPLKWVQRGLALTAVVLGLALRRPGVASYEPFGTLFDFRGTAVAWAFLVMIILASLMMYRPFCNYLCPIDPVVDFIAASRRWLREGWKKWRKRTTTA